MSNKKIGNAFEQEWAEYLQSKGHWAYIFPTKTGQPCDIISVFRNEAFFWENKVSETDEFPLSRIESNQHTASEYIMSCGNKNYFLVVKFKSGIMTFHLPTVIKFSRMIGPILRYDDGMEVEELWR